jgi:hypothetical protein
MKQMDVKKFLIPFVAVLTVFLIASVSALTVDSTIVTEFNGVDLFTSGMSMAGIADDVIPIRVTFDADSNVSDVRVRVWMESYRDEVSVKTSRFDVLQGVTYTKLLSLELPEDLKDTSKDFTLHVSISSADEYDSVDYTVKMQRETYSYNILSVDYPVPVSAGDIMPVSIVVENNGMQDLDDGFVIITIPELDVSAKGYFGDLVSVENDDNEDSTQKTVFVKIPSNANDGVYEMKARVYNSDASQSMNQLFRIDESDSATTVISTTTTDDVEVEEQASGIVALTVVLVIVFVVLLVVLVVLLTRKEKSTDEVETSYY